LTVVGKDGDIDKSGAVGISSSLHWATWLVWYG
jgi:hypothetical protein